MNDNYNSEDFDLNVDKMNQPDPSHNGESSYAEESSQESTVYRMVQDEIPKERFDMENNDETYYGQGETTMEEERNHSQINTETDSQKKPGGKGKEIGKRIVSAAIFGVVAGLTFQGVSVITSSLLGNKTEVVSDESNLDIQGSENTKIATTVVGNGISNQSNDVSDVVGNTMPSIVSITSTVTQSYNWFGQNYDEESEGSGSGIIVGKNDNELLIVTNNHVVEGSTELGVTFIDGKVVSAKIKGTDSTEDLAVIAVSLDDVKKSTLETIKVAVLGSSDDVKVGQMAIAIGNALGYGQSVTVGYISAKDREVQVSDTTLVLLQTDAAINPGNSGGALLNINGEVIGINSVKYSSSEVEGMGYAIPISKATPIINELMNREQLEEDEKGYLGITGLDVTEEDNQKYNMPLGVYVSETAKDGAAEKAGILKGDIITAINGTKVTSITAVQEKVNNYPVDTEVVITVMRNNNGSYKEKEITVTLKGRDTLKSLETEEGTTVEEEDQNNPSQQLPEVGPEEEDQQSIEDFFNNYFN